MTIHCFSPGSKLASASPVLLSPGFREIWSNRTQVVRMGQSSSSPASLDTGVPQGSVLGPILFSIYISLVGLLVSCQNILHQQYADDTQLYISLSPADPYPGISHLKSCLTLLHSWFCQNGLCLNPTTKFGRYAAGL